MKVFPNNVIPFKKRNRVENGFVSCHVISFHVMSCLTVKTQHRQLRSAQNPNFFTPFHLPFTHIHPYILQVATLTGCPQVLRQLSRTHIKPMKLCMLLHDTYTIIHSGIINHNQITGIPYSTYPYSGAWSIVCGFSTEARSGSRSWKWKKKLEVEVEAGN